MTLDKKKKHKTAEDIVAEELREKALQDITPVSKDDKIFEARKKTRKEMRGLE